MQLFNSLVNKLWKMLAIGAGLCSVGLTVILMSPLTAYANPISVWTTSGNTLPQGLFGASAVSYGGYAYVFGGDNGTEVLSTVYSTKLNHNGSVWSWATSSNPLPQALDGAVSVQYGGYVYVLGGLEDGFTLSNAVYSASLDKGSVSTWATSSHPLPQTLYFQAAVAYNGYIYVFGGDNTGGGSRVNTVYSAPINKGIVGSWSTSANTLPTGLATVSASEYNGYVYIAGGGDDSGPTNTVYYAALNNGSVGSWSTSPNNLPDSIRGNMIQAAGGYLYVAGGIDNLSGSVDTFFYAPINSNGSIGSWSTSSNSLPDAIYLGSSVYYNDRFYTFGGIDNSDYSGINGVFYTDLNDFRAPSLSTKTSTVASGSSITVNVLSGVLGDPDSSTLKIIAQPLHGKATDPPGTITYIPNSGYVGSDSLVYQVCSLNDESLCSQARLDFSVDPAGPATGFGMTKSSGLAYLAVIAGVSLSTGLVLRDARKKRY